MNSRTKTLLIGGALGTLIGVFAGYLYYNSNVEVAEEGGVEQLPAPTPGEALKFGLSLLGLLRLITG